MKDESAASKEEEKTTSAGGPAVITAKKKQKEMEIKISDEMLYRPHGLGLDTGHY
jgi:hypothetical protein